MEPSVAINIMETDVRAVIRLVLDYTSEISEKLADELRWRQTEERRKRSPARVSEDLLDYAHLGDLKTIIVTKKNWPLFEPVFRNRQEFEVLCDFVIRYRNAVAHSRVLLPYERTHLEGIAGLIRAQTTIFRSSEGADMQYYPVIEQVTDSLGHTDRPDGPRFTELRLEVGDQVQFRALANDPQGRTLTWSLMVSHLILDSAEGNEVTLTWDVLEQHVGDDISVHIDVVSDGKYHRRSHSDDWRSFWYHVVPPE